jgi:dephospho-CoA kinase
MHPRIYEVVKAQIEECRRKGVGVVVLEASLLIEAGWTSTVDELWVTTAHEATVLRRLKERVGMSKAESRARIRSQLPSKERLKYANVVIDTNCDLEELRAKVKELWQKFKTGI